MEQSLAMGESVDAILEAVRGLTMDGETTQSQIAREVGVSPATISTFLSGSYRGDNDAVRAKIGAWLKAREDRATAASAMPSAPFFLGLGSAKKIHAVLSYAQVAGDLAVIYGSPGVGKTRAIEAYALEHNNVWVVTGRPSVKGVRPLLAEASRVMRLRRVYARAAVVTHDIIQATRGTAGLLIIDEAQHLETAALEELRSIHDAAGIGLALAGNEHVYARISGDRGVAFAQLFSRVGKRVRISTVAHEDALALARAMGVSGRDEEALAVRIAAEPGGLRGLVKALRLAATLASGQGVGMGLAHIHAAHQDLSNQGGS